MNPQTLCAIYDFTMHQRLVIICLFFLYFNNEIIAQDNPSIKSQTLTVPVTRHSKNSPLPDLIRVIGIIDAEPSLGMCGIFCFGGVIKVKLTQKIEGYKEDYIFLVTACLRSEVRKNDHINVQASKLKFNEEECYYQNIMNPFNSNGVPFYKLSEKETATIK